MIANGAVVKMVLAVALGGSAGAISYVSLLHASSDRGPAITAATSEAGVRAAEPPKTANTNVERMAPKPVAKTGHQAHGRRAKTVAAVSPCSPQAKRRSKATGACPVEIGSGGQAAKSKILGYTKAMAIEPLPVQPVEVQHVDKPLPLGSSEVFKPVTDAMP